MVGDPYIHSLLAHGPHVQREQLHIQIYLFRQGDMHALMNLDYGSLRIDSGILIAI